MIQISESAQTHFRKLIERESLPGLGVRLSAHMPGTTQADVRLEFAGRAVADPCTEDQGRSASRIGIAGGAGALDDRT